MSPKPWLLTHLSGKTLHSALGWIVFIGALIFIVIIGTAMAHEATNTAGQPLNIVYPPSCCNSAITSPFGDCAPIEDRYVTEREDGYHINLPAGAHPMLKRKGYIGVVPYEGAKRPISNDYHICLSEDGGARYCFFPKPGMM